VSTDIFARHHTASPEETISIGERIGSLLAKASANGGLVLLMGALGAGKTVLAQGIARGLGIHERIVSPTYTIISEYRTNGVNLHHVDLYRIEGKEQLENLGLEDILRGDSIVLVEWGEKLEPILPSAGEPRIRVTLALAQDGGRDILVEDLSA
jgi:tRNA threonylcarbamoyladenosine biosynthesis protein TsaE